MSINSGGTLFNLRTRVFRLLEDQPWIDSNTIAIPATPAGGNIAITVNDPANWATGSRWEIDQEIFYVTSGGTNPLTVTRAYESTTAAAHPAGTQARRDPRFLSVTVNESINVVLNSWLSPLIPRLVWDDGVTATGGFQPLKWIIAAPLDARKAIGVYWQRPGFTQLVAVKHAGLRTYPTSLISTGLGVELWEQGLPGQTIKVLYEKNWPYLLTDTDTIPTDFPEEADDLIVVGAALYLAGWRLIPKWRLDEIEWYREGSSPQPQNQSAQFWSMMQRNWNARMQQVRMRRPNQPGNVGKVYVPVN